MLPQRAGGRLPSYAQAEREIDGVAGDEAAEAFTPVQPDSTISPSYVALAAEYRAAQDR